MGLFMMITCRPSFAAVEACNPDNIFSVVDRSSGGTSPCTVGTHRDELETGYYQNASAIGGTALAAYPLARLRYGLTPAFEIIAEPTTAIAKNGLNGQGIYTWSRNGGGVKFRIYDSGKNAVALRAIYLSQSSETATISNHNHFDAGIIVRSALSSRYTTSASVGRLDYTQVPTASHRKTSAWYENFALSYRLAQRTQSVFTINSQSSLSASSNAQSKYGLAVQQSLAGYGLLDVEIGSAINTSSGTKAHYLGAGLSFLLSKPKK